jgi:hypothetical protein
MGCWNATCGISFLPILAGAPVVCFIIKERHWSAQHRNKIDRHPIGFPIRGNYDEQGSLEDIVENAITAEYVEDFNAKILSGKLAYRSHDFKKSRFSNIQDVVDLCERGCSESESEIYYLFMIHADLYDMLVGEVNDDMRRFAEYSIRDSDTNKFDRITYENTRDVANGAVLDPKVFPMGYPELNEEEKEWMEQQRIGTIYGKVFYVNFTIEEYHLRSKLVCKPMDEYLDDLIRLARLNYVMDQLRRSFNNPGHGGSQEQDYDTYSGLIAWEKKHITQQKKRFDD